MKRQFGQKAQQFFVVLAWLTCTVNTGRVSAQTQQQGSETADLTEEVIDHPGITNPNKLSAATKRALKWPKLGNEWFIQFEVQDLKGDLAYEEGVVRRDPSGMISHDGRYVCLVLKKRRTQSGLWR